MSAPFEADPAARVRRLLAARQQEPEQSRPSSSASPDVLTRVRRHLEKTAAATAPRASPVSAPASITPSPIPVGFYVNHQTGEPEKQLFYHGERGVLAYGLNGAGKSTRFLIELLMTSVGRSILVLDIKGELAAQTAQYRRDVLGCDVKIVAPYPIADLSSDGYNPGQSLKPDIEEEFTDRAGLFAEAINEVGEGKDPHWDESAQGFAQAAIMAEAIWSRHEGRAFSWRRVRLLLCEPDEFETYTDAAGKRRKRQIKGVAVNAKKMIAEGNEVITQLIGRFIREHGQNELAGIQSTFDTKTRFMLSPPIWRDLEKGTWSMRQLRERETTVYVCLKAGEVTRKRRYARLLLTDALYEHLQPGPVKTLFILDEYRAAIGQMNIVQDVWALVRGFGVTLMPFFQSATQLEKLLGKEWQNFEAQAGIVLTIGPPNDDFTAEHMSKRCGVTTVAQAGFNLGNGVNSGGGINAGTGMNDSGFSSNQGSGQNFGHNMSGGLSIQQTERRAFLPQELMDMKAGEGRAWLPGFGSKSVPLFLPNYWNRKADWAAHVKPNPLRKG